MYIITADQIDSRHGDDLAGPAVDDLNERYGDRIALPVDRNAGDEIQALAADAMTALAIIADLTRTGTWSVGCGVGHVRTPLPAHTREASGPGFIAARAAVERAKGTQFHFALESESPRDAPAAEALIELLLLVRSRRTVEGWEMFDLVASGLTRTAAAKALGITPQAASQRARTAAIRSEITAMPALASVLSRLDADTEQNGIGGGSMSIIVIALAVVGIVFAILALGARRHWLVIGSAAVVAFGVVSGAIVQPSEQPAWAAVAIGIGFSAIGVIGGSPVVALVLSFAQGGVELGTHGGIVVEDDAPHGREILRGGATIGYLERFALIGAVIAGQGAAVAIIVAVKGLGRFSELDDSRARERFIIGTLTSLCWAGVCVAAAILAS